MKKEIIGYMLKPEYVRMEKALNAILEEVHWGFVLETKRTYSYKNVFIQGQEEFLFLDKLGLVKIWFNPIYKELFKVNDFVTIVNQNHGGSIGVGKVGQIITSDTCYDVMKGKDVWHYAGDGDIRLATINEIIKLLEEEDVKGYKISWLLKIKIGVIKTIQKFR